jgi:arsenate reductase
MRVLFLCTENAARSQIAEALLRDMSKGTIEVCSAGSRPTGHVHPLALASISRMLGHEVAGLRPKSLDEFAGQHFDFVITTCDRTAEECPIFPGAPEHIHWSFENPAAVAGDAEAQAHAFHKVATEIAARLRIWLSLPAQRQHIDRMLAAAR